MPATPYLRTEALCKRFGEVIAVDRVELAIARNEVFALLGSSGCGKSTLLRVLAGLEQPTSGRVVLDGEDITDQPPYVRPTNMMFQSYALFPHMTVAANIGYGLKQDKVPRAEIRERVGRMLEMVQMAALADRMPHQLSGGQQQRVALARSLVKHPKLLLLDEPLGALDRKIREHTRLELVDTIRRVGVTCILVTHDQEEAMTMADRIGVMSEGRLAQVGTPREIYEHPNSRFTADFVGDTNIFRGMLQATAAAGARVVTPDLGGEIHVADAAAAQPGADVWVSVRPERVEVQREAPTSEANHCIGTVRDIAYLGSASVFHVELPTRRVLRAAVPTARWNAGTAPARGDTVHLSWRPSACVVLTE
jgi:putrescine transport system ATP-binding protein